MYQCNAQHGGCESIVPEHYTNCPVCGKKLSYKQDKHEYSFIRPTKETEQETKFSAFVEDSEIVLGEFNDINNY